VGGRLALASYGDAPAAYGSAAGGNLNLSVQLLKITGGRFSVGKVGGGRKPLALEDVAIQVRDFSSASAFPFSFSAKVGGGGAIKIDGKAGPIDAGNVVMTPVEIALDVTALDLAATPMAAQSPGLAGLASFHGTANSAGGRVTIAATLKAEHLRLAKDGRPAKPVVEFDFALAHDMAKHGGELERGDLHVGTALAHLTGTYQERGDVEVLEMKFLGARMPVPELAELLPPLAIKLPSGSSLEGGAATANFTVAGPVDKLVIAGSVALNKTRLAGFDLGAKMSAIETLAGIKGGPDTDIESLAADLRMAPEGIAVTNLHFLAPAIGELSGSGTVSPADALDFKMSATLHTSGAAALVGKAAVPFRIEGTEESPVFKADTKALAASAAQAIKQNPGKAASGLLNLLGRRKKPQ
jgi:AsmA protein